MSKQELLNRIHNLNQQNRDKRDIDAPLYTPRETITSLDDMLGRRASFKIAIRDRIENREANILDWYRHPEYGVWFLVEMVGYARPVMLEADSFVRFIGIGVGLA